MVLTGWRRVTAVGFCIVALAAVSPSVPVSSRIPSQPPRLVEAAVAADQAQQLKNEKDPVSGQELKDTSLVNWVNDAYVWAASIGGLLAVMMLIFAGYRYITSYGDPEAISNAKDVVLKALIGLTLLILAALLLETINPKTVNPNAPGKSGEIDLTQPH